MATVGFGGIYEIVNTNNGKRYVGSARMLPLRLRQHRNRLRAGIHNNRHLQSSWAKHGEASFIFKPLIVCRAEDLLFFEQRSIDLLKPAFNICPTAGSTLGRVHSDETKRKIAARKIGIKMPPRSEEYRTKLSEAQKGRGKSPEHMAALQAGRRAAKRTPEQLAQVSESLKLAYIEGRHRRDRPKEYREKISNTLRGRTLTAEHRANVSAAMRGKTRGPYKNRSS